MIPTTKEFLTKELIVNSFHSDFTGKLSIQSLLLLFQEVAWEHATINGFGYEHLKEKGFFWALSRLHINLIDLPLWTQEISLSTWPSGTEGPFALRDYLISDQSGKKLVGGTSSWLIVDINTRRPQRPDSFRDKMPIREDIRGTDGNAQRIIVPNNVNEAILYEHTARLADIDVNGHINNTKYIEWAINSISESDFRNLRLEQIDVNFLAEGFSGDTFEIILKLEDDSRKIIGIKRKSDQKELAIIQIIFTKL
jgi:acyl-ACP thioesterase